jgi:hypothetical protein
LQGQEFLRRLEAFALRAPARSDGA